MKPVEIEDFTTRLKALTADLLSTDEYDSKVNQLLATTEQNLKSMDDNKESKVLLALLSVLLLPLSAYLLYTGYYWPSLIAVAWLGALLYYNTHERSLSIMTLKEKAKIAPLQPNSKINYLLAALQQKQERLSLIKIYNYTFWPFAIFMGQLILNTDLGSIMLWVILILIFLANAVFWHMNYKPLEQALDNLKQSLHDLQYNLIIRSTGASTEEE